MELTLFKYNLFELKRRSWRWNYSYQGVQKYQNPSKLQLIMHKISIYVRIWGIKVNWDDLWPIWKLLWKKYRIVDQYHPGTKVGIWISQKIVFDLIHKTSSFTGKNSIQIQVIGTQEKKLQLVFFRARRLNEQNFIWTCID